MSGQAQDVPPAAYSRWCRRDDVRVSDMAILLAWRKATPGERGFWRMENDLAAPQPQPAPGLRSDAETAAMLRADLADATRPSKKTQVEDEIAAAQEPILALLDEATRLLLDTGRQAEAHAGRRLRKTAGLEP